MVQAACSKCGYRFVVPEHALGKITACYRCGAREPARAAAQKETRRPVKSSRPACRIYVSPWARRAAAAVLTLAILALATRTGQEKPEGARPSESVLLRCTLCGEQEETTRDLLNEMLMDDSREHGPASPALVAPGVLTCPACRKRAYCREQDVSLFAANGSLGYVIPLQDNAVLARR